MKDELNGINTELNGIRKSMQQRTDADSSSTTTLGAVSEDFQRIVSQCVSATGASIESALVASSTTVADALKYLQYQQRQVVLKIDAYDAIVGQLMASNKRIQETQEKNQLVLVAKLDDVITMISELKIAIDRLQPKSAPALITDVNSIREALKQFYMERYDHLSVMHDASQDQSVHINFMRTFKMAQAEVDAARREETVGQNETLSATAWIDRAEKDANLCILFIEGQAGLGKSSMCKYIGRDQCVSAGRIVLVVELPVLLSYLGKDAPHVSRDLAFKAALGGKFEDIRELILSKPILWVLDSFDEVASTKERLAKDGLQMFINDCFKPTNNDFRHKDDMVLLTSRKERGSEIDIYGPLNTALAASRALHLVLRKWNRHDIDEFVNSVFEARRAHCRDSRLEGMWIDEAQKAARVAATAPGLHTWEGVPLMYDIMCSYIADTYHEDFLRQGSVQDVELFEITPETLLGEAIRRVYDREVKKANSTTGAQQLLPFEEAQRGAQKYAYEKLAFHFKENRQKRNEAMESTLSRLGWFVKVTGKGGTLYRFAHKSFAEYFRALTIYDQLDTAKECKVAMTSTDIHEVSDVTVSLLVHRLKRELKKGKDENKLIRQRVSHLVSFATEGLWKAYMAARKNIAHDLGPLSKIDILNGEVRDPYKGYEKWREVLQINIVVEVCAVLDQPDELLRYRGMKPFASVRAQYFYLLVLLPAARHGHFALVQKTAEIIAKRHKDEIRPGQAVLPSQALVQVAETLARLPRFQGRDVEMSRLTTILVVDHVAGETNSAPSSQASPREIELHSMIKYLKENLHAEVTTMEICRGGCFLLLEERLKDLMSPAIAYLPEGQARLNAFRAEASNLLQMSLANEHRECAAYIVKILNTHGMLLSLSELKNLAEQAAKQNVDLNVDVTGDV